MKTETQILTAMRLDLKDSGSVWSDAELKRSIEKAVADFTRFRPKEEVYEVTGDFTVTNESFTTPATASATAIVNAQTIYGETDGATLSIADLTPDVPRRLTVTLNDANYSVTELTLVVKGYNQDGHYIEENWYLSQLKVSGTAYQGKLYFSRISQVELNKISGASAGDTVSVGTGNAYDSFIYLANKPIKPKSDTVTSSPTGTSYDRDDDYTIDYSNGRIKFITGGEMAAGTAYLINYTKSQIEIDLSSLPNFIGVEEVVYPATDIPQTTVSHSIWNNVLTLLGGGYESQESMASGLHAAVRYHASHTPPSAYAPGSYPGFIEDTIILAAEAYALFIKALQYEHAAVTDIAYVDDALDKVAVELDDSTLSVKKALSNANAVWTDEVKHLLTDALPNVQDLLEAGDDLINIVPVGADAAELYRRYGETAYVIARAYEQKRADLLTEASRYIDKAGTWIGEGQTRIANVAQYLELASRFRAEGNDKRNEAWSVWMSPSLYLSVSSTSVARQPNY